MLQTSPAQQPMAPAAPPPVVRRGIFLFVCVAILENLAGVHGSFCNGGDFCSLPLVRTSFPGTHNSGSFDLTGPTAYGAVAEVALCFYLNHESNYVAQLDLGVRYFNIDLCDKDDDPDTLYNCHAQSKTESSIAFGEPILESFQSMKTWMVENPNEIIILQPADMTLSSSYKTYTWKTLVESAWGCQGATTGLDLDSFDNVSSDDVGCLYFTSLPGQKLTLGDLVKKNYRVIALPYKADYLVDTWKAAYTTESYRNSDLYDYHESVAESAVSYDEGLYLFSIFQSQSIPDADTIESCQGLDCIVTTIEQITGTNMACNYVLGVATNTYFYPSSDPVLGRYISSDEGCDGACCKGYRSPVEKMHQEMLDRGATIWGVISDYIHVGEQTETVRRMNEATLRRMNGELEPGISWIECNEPAFWSIAGVTLGFILTLTAVIIIKTKCCGWSKYPYVAVTVKRLIRRSCGASCGIFQYCFGVCRVSFCPCLPCGCPCCCCCYVCCYCCSRRLEEEADTCDDDQEPQGESKQVALPSDVGQKASVGASSISTHNEELGTEDLESQQDLTPPGQQQLPPLEEGPVVAATAVAANPATTQGVERLSPAVGYNQAEDLTLDVSV